MLYNSNINYIMYSIAVTILIKKHGNYLDIVIYKLN